MKTIDNFKKIIENIEDDKVKCEMEELLKNYKKVKTKKNYYKKKYLQIKEPKGVYQCFHCGSYSVAWSGDFSFEDYGIEGEGVINCCHCSNCGADIEYFVPIKEEEDDSKS